MKLQTVLENLTGIKKYNNSWWGEFVNDLTTKYGFEENSMGMFSRVLTRPDLNYVYKVFDNDSAYMSFINYTLSNPNKHFPVCLKNPKQISKFLKSYYNGRNKFIVIKIEKLNPISPTNAKHFNMMFENNVKKFADYGSEAIFVDHIDKSKGCRGIQDYLKNYDQQIQDIFYILAKIYKDLPFKLDIHSGNFMERDDGTIVIIDPIMMRDDDKHVTMFDQPRPQRYKPSTRIDKDNRAFIKF